MKTSNPLYGFEIDPEKITYVGEGLQRPECILAERDGSLWAADSRGGVMHIHPDGKQDIITQKRTDEGDINKGDVNRFFEGTLPNGLASVSYTHLDVYKRQALHRAFLS